VNGYFQDTKAEDALKPYRQGFCEGCYAGIADVVASKVELFDGGVFLSEIKQKDTVSGGANPTQNACKTLWRFR